MFTAADTTTRHLPATARQPRAGFLSWLVRLNAAYREKQQFAQLDTAARRDMGLDAPEKITVAEIMYRDVR